MSTKTDTIFLDYKGFDFEFPINSYRVVDGDTVEVNLDLGFNISYEVDVRIEGINAPEKRGSEKGAGLLVKKWVEDWFFKHREYQIICTVTELGKFGGRVIGDFYVTGDDHYENGPYISEVILQEGLAKPYKGGKKDKYTESELKAIQKLLS